MIANPHRWSAHVLLTPGRSEYVFTHWSRATGLQTLDAAPAVVGPDVRSERDYLQELYYAVLTFQERRA